MTFNRNHFVPFVPFCGPSLLQNCGRSSVFWIAAGGLSQNPLVFFTFSKGIFVATVCFRYSELLSAKGFPGNSPLSGDDLQ